LGREINIDVTIKGRDVVLLEIKPKVEDTD
jgi:hypothetical protein